MVGSDRKYPLQFLRNPRRRASKHSIFHDISALRTYTLSHTRRRSSLALVFFLGSVYSHIPYASIHIIFNPGGERRYRELRSGLETFRAHTILPPTSSSLHISPTHAGDDGATRENQGPDSVYSVRAKRFKRDHKVVCSTPII
jgi:hypothetical protein